MMATDKLTALFAAFVALLTQQRVFHAIFGPI